MIQAGLREFYKTNGLDLKHYSARNGPCQGARRRTRPVASSTGLVFTDTALALMAQSSDGACHRRSAELAAQFPPDFGFMAGESGGTGFHRGRQRSRRIHAARRIFHLWALLQWGSLGRDDLFEALIT